MTFHLFIQPVTKIFDKLKVLVDEENDDNLADYLFENNALIKKSNTS